MSSSEEATRTQKCGTPQCTGNRSPVLLAGHAMPGRARAARLARPREHLLRQESDLREHGGA